MVESRFESYSPLTPVNYYYNHNNIMGDPNPVPILNDNWKSQDVSKWTSLDTLNWINGVASVMNKCCTDLPGEAFIRFSGQHLIQMSETDFRNINQEYGPILYYYLQQELRRRNSFYENDENIRVNEDSKREKLTKNAKKKHIEKKGYKIWEFLLDLLGQPSSNPNLIAWEDRDGGIFRFVQSDQVAKLWGLRKNNKNMNYEKMTRAMRYYYKSKILEPMKEKLVYKFGPEALAWGNSKFLRPEKIWYSSESHEESHSIRQLY